jgi:hypothetical protein
MTIDEGICCPGQQYGSWLGLGCRFRLSWLLERTWMGWLDHEFLLIYCIMRV